MFYARKNSAGIGGKSNGLTKAARVIASCERLLATQKLQETRCPAHQSGALEQATTEATLEWQRARPFNKLPRDGVLRFLSKFLPGGRYHKLDSNQLEMAMQKDHGDIFIVPAFMGRPNTLVTHNPADFERVFRNEGTWPIRPFATLRHHRNKLHAEFYKEIEGVLSTQGERWSTFRTVVNPVLMQPKIMQIYVDKMAQVNQEFVEQIRLIRDPESLEVPSDFEDYLQCWLVESLSIVALDKPLGLLRERNENHAEALKMLAALNKIFTLAYDLEWKPSLWRRIPTPKFKRYMRALDEMQDITLKYIDRAIAKLSAEEAQGIPRPERELNAFEQLLKVDKQVATVMCIDLFMAGINTTTSLATAILLCLAKNPEKQEKLRTEVMRVLPQKHGVFTADALNNIPYLRACIKEAARIYPVSVGVVRVTQSDIVLSGYRVPKGTVVNVISTSLYRNEQYFPRPLEYLPERWLRSRTTEAGTETPPKEEAERALRPSNPFIFLPFGVGPRVCLGRRVSELELELGIARLVRNFQIEFNYPVDKPFKSMFVNMPNMPLKFKFIDIV